MGRYKRLRLTTWLTLLLLISSRTSASAYTREEFNAVYKAGGEYGGGYAAGEPLKAPDFTLKDIDGREWTLGQLRGKVAVYIMVGNST